MEVKNAQALSFDDDGHLFVTDVLEGAGPNGSDATRLVKVDVSDGSLGPWSTRLTSRTPPTMHRSPFASKVWPFIGFEV